MILVGSGHRPNKLGGYSEEIFCSLTLFLIEYLPRFNPTELISGMAIGFDQAFALAGIELGVPFTAAIPFIGQQKKWPPQSQQLYKNILSKAKQIVIVSDGDYASWKLTRRNDWMVEKGHEVVALYDGSSGGTANCLKTAADLQKPIHNLWQNWINWQEDLKYEQFKEEVLSFALSNRIIQETI